MPRPKLGDDRCPLRLDNAAEAEVFMKREGVTPEGDDAAEWIENDEIPEDEDSDDSDDDQDDDDESNED